MREAQMITPAIQPPPVMPSKYGPTAAMRAAELPGIGSLSVKDLFGEFTPEIFNHDGGDLEVIRKATEDTLAGVDMSMIKPGDTVNILSCEHGFSIFGGGPYVEMLKAIKDAVQERTGCKPRLRLAMYRGFKEADEVREYYGLDEIFEGRVAGAGPWDKGLALETEIGTVHVVKKVFDADWFIHAYYDDPREIYFHRMLNRGLKAFVMAYARVETRSAFHFSFLNRGGAVLPRAIFNSRFIQDKHAFSCFLRTSPNGIIAIDGDNDLYAIDRRITINHLKTFGKMVRLIADLDDFVAIWDGGRWGYYIHAGGVCFGVVMNCDFDAFDLEQPAALSGLDDLIRNRDPEYIMDMNKAIKAVIINQSWPGIVISDVPKLAPTILVGQENAELWRRDPANPHFMDYAVTAETLPAAFDFAKRVGGTDKALAFDGSFGYLTLTEPLAAEMLAKAPAISHRVDEEYLPMWLKQRGIDPAEV
jgi:hypothetical protein